MSCHDKWMMPQLILVWSHVNLPMARLSPSRKHLHQGWTLRPLPPEGIRNHPHQGVDSDDLFGCFVHRGGRHTHPTGW